MFTEMTTVKIKDYQQAKVVIQIAVGMGYPNIDADRYCAFYKYIVFNPDVKKITWGDNCVGHNSHLSHLSYEEFIDSFGETDEEKTYAYTSTNYYAICNIRKNTDIIGKVKVKPIENKQYNIMMEDETGALFLGYDSGLKSASINIKGLTIKKGIIKDYIGSHSFNKEETKQLIKFLSGE